MEFTCVIEKDGKNVFADTARGIAPLIKVLESGLDVSGGKATDKIVGKAAALLYVLMKVSCVKAEVLSIDGKRILEQNGIECCGEILTEKIINRQGDGLCPMELAVSGIEEPQEAFVAIKNKQKELMKR